MTSRTNAIFQIGCKHRQGYEKIPRISQIKYASMYTGGKPRVPTGDMT